jgi:hypothetical protein
LRRRTDRLLHVTGGFLAWRRDDGHGSRRRRSRSRAVHLPHFAPRIRAAAGCQRRRDVVAPHQRIRCQWPAWTSHRHSQRRRSNGTPRHVIAKMLPHQARIRAAVLLESSYSLNQLTVPRTL